MSSSGIHIHSKTEYKQCVRFSRSLAGGTFNRRAGVRGIDGELKFPTCAVTARLRKRGN